MLRTLTTKTLPAEPQIAITRTFVAEHGTALCNAAGKIAGIVTFDESRYAEYAQKGVTFLGVGGDALVLANALRALAKQVKAV